MALYNNYAVKSKKADDTDINLTSN